MDELQSVLGMEDNKDYLSSFPEPILRHIISFLPMKCAIQTSSLSRRWRYLWTTITDLEIEFDLHNSLKLIDHVWTAFGGRRVGDWVNKAKKLEGFVNQLLKLHDGPTIRRLYIHLFPHSSYAPEIEKLIQFAMRKHVQDLHLDFSGTFLFSTGNFIFPSIESLFKGGFGSLKTLYLRQVNVDDESFQCLFFNCPVMESLSLVECKNLGQLILSLPNRPIKSLTVIRCSGLDMIEIYAPNLLSFHYFGKSETNFRFNYIPCVVDVMFIFINLHDYEYGLKTLLCDISHVKVLTICSRFIEKYMCAEDYIPNQLSQFHNLKELQLRMPLKSNIEIFAIACLLKNTLYLEKLFIDVARDRGILTDFMGGHWDVQWEPFYCLANHLKMLKIKGFSCQPVHMELLKLLLENSVVLESITILYSDLIFPEGSVRKHLRLWQQHSSPHAKLVLNGNLGDPSLYPTHDIDVTFHLNGTPFSFRV